MSDEEVDELLKAVDTSSGEINYTGMLYYFYWGTTEAWAARSDETIGRACGRKPIMEEKANMMENRPCPNNSRELEDQRSIQYV
jgi:hypothetical protein